MKERIKLLTCLYLLFLLMLSISGMTEGWISESVYYLAFAAPLALGLVYLRKRGIAEDGDLTLFRIKSGDVSQFLPLILPTTALVLLISQLTAWLLGLLFGATNTVVIEGSIWRALLEHALLPALLEELLFRYLPMRVLPRREVRLTVMLSTVFFAFAHTSLFSIPYALLAGAVYVTADLISDSVIPSMFMHFVNNFVSVLLIYYNDNSDAKIAVFVTFGLLFAASLVYLAIFGKKFFAKVKLEFSQSPATSHAAFPLLFVLPSLLCAVIALL